MVAGPIGDYAYSRCVAHADAPYEAMLGRPPTRSILTDGRSNRIPIQARGKRAFRRQSPRDAVARHAEKEIRIQTQIQKGIPNVGVANQAKIKLVRSRHAPERRPGSGARRLHLVGPQARRALVAGVGGAQQTSQGGTLPFRDVDAGVLYQ